MILRLTAFRNLIRCINRGVPSEHKVACRFAGTSESRAGSYGMKRSPMRSIEEEDQAKLLEDFREAHKLNDYFRFAKLIADVKKTKELKIEVTNMLTPNWIRQIPGVEVTDIIRHLGVLGFDCNQVNDKTICKKLVRQMLTLPDISAKKLHGALLGLAGCNFKASYVSKYEFDPILGSLYDVFKDAHPAMMVNVIRELGNIQVYWGYIPVSVQDQLLNWLLEVSSDISETQKAQIIFGLGRMRFNFLTASNVGQKLVLSLASSTLTFNTINHKDNFILGSTSAGLAMMHLTYADAPASLQKALTESLDRCLMYGSDDESTINYMNAMGDLCIKWNVLSPKAQTQCQRITLKQLESGERRYAGMALKFMHQMEAKYSSLIPEIQEYLRRYLSNKFKQLSVTSQAFYLQTLGRLEMPWSVLTGSDLKAATESIDFIVADSSLLMILLDGLNGMNFKFSDLTQEQQKKFQQSLEEYVEQLDGSARVVFLLNELSYFELKWTEVPSVSLRKNIPYHLVEILDSFRQNGEGRILICLQELVKADLTAGELSRGFYVKLNKALIEQIDKVTSGDVVLLLSLLSKLKVTLNELDQGMQGKMWDCLMKSASELSLEEVASLSNTLESFQLIDNKSELGQLRETLVANVVKLIPHLKASQIKQALRTLVALKVKWHQMDPPVRGSITNTIRQSLVFMSDTDANSVVAELSSLAFQIVFANPVMLMGYLVISPNQSMSKFLNNVSEISTKSVSFGAVGVELKASILPVVREILDDISWIEADDEKITITMITGGITNILYLVHNTISDSKVIVRVFGMGTELFIDRSMENILFARLSALGLGPSFHGLFQNGRVEGYVNGRPLDPDELSLPLVYRKIAKSVAKFHSLHIPEVGTDLDWLWNKTLFFFKLGDDLQFTGEKSSLFQLVRFEERKEECSRLRDRMERLEKQVSGQSDWKSKGHSFGFSRTLVHNDLLAPNLLLSNDKCENEDDGITMIDYEYGSYSHRAYDLGNHFNEYCGFDVNLSKYPTSEQRSSFARLYLSHLTELDQESCKNVEFVDGFQEISVVFSLVSHLFWGAWAVVQAGHSSVDFDYLNYARLRFEAYDHLKQEVNII